MQLLVILSFIMAAFAPLASGQSDEPDAYCLNLVREVLKRGDEPKVIHSWSQKRLYRLGDCVTIAILKVANERQLESAGFIQQLLPTIRSSFAEPQLIERESDNVPRITLLFLESIQRSINDHEANENIRETIEFVKSKGSH